MPMFVLNRTHVLDIPGHKIRFEKGQPTYIPPEGVKLAIGIGAEPVDGDKDKFFEAEAAEKAPLTPQEKEEMFFAAFEILIERNERDDFDGAGVPSATALKKELDFSFTKKDIVAAYQKFRAQKAEEL